MQRVRLLDATLRDGSYCVDFQFTAADTGVLVSMLDAAGVGFIELGHGSGTFNHKAPPHFQSKTRQAATDDEYMATARRCARGAKLGVITGPFGTDDLGAIAAHRLDFVRLAAMADKALDPANLKMCERAKSLGLIFSINLMQSVAISPTRIGEIAVEYAKAGADWFYVVDSSGGMMPGVVSEYIARARDATSMTLGFHAHHNSGMAIANCIAAIDAGARLVDGTLQGLGRDVGNAPTEQLLFVLQRLGYEREIDVEHVCHAGDLVRNLLEKGDDPTYIAAGTAEVHSSNVEALVKLAHDKGLASRSLLAAIGQGTTKLIGAGLKTFPDDVLGPALAKTPPLAEPTPQPAVVEVLADEMARTSAASLTTLAEIVFARAGKWHLRSALHLVPAEHFPFAHPLPWDAASVCGFTVGVSPGDLAGLDFEDRAPDILAIDPALAPALATAPAGAASRMLLDPFAPLVVEATLTLAALAHQAGTRTWIVASDAVMAAELAGRTKEHAVVGPRELEASVRAVHDKDTVIVVGSREIPNAVAALAERGVRVLRPGVATAVAARVTTLLDLLDRLDRSGGSLLDPLFVATKGKVVVDDLLCPSAVVDGSGDRNAFVHAARVRAASLVRGRGRL